MNGRNDDNSHGTIVLDLYPPLKACCQTLVDTYMTLFTPPRESAALFCRHCSARIVARDGAWIEETL